MSVEPVEQLFAVRADDLRLWIVHVRVDEARQDQRVPAGGAHRDIRRELRQYATRRPEVRDPALAHCDDGVGFMPKRGLDADVERIGHEGKRRPAQGVAASGFRADGFHSLIIRSACSTLAPVRPHPLSKSADRAARGLGLLVRIRYAPQVACITALWSHGTGEDFVTKRRVLDACAAALRRTWR